MLGHPATRLPGWCLVAGLVPWLAGCGGGGGSPAAVTPPGSVTVSLSISSNSISLGNSAQLSWSSTNATSCQASGAWTGSKPTSSGSAPETVTPTAVGQYPYTLTCTGDGGSNSDSVTLSVTTGGLTSQIQAATQTAENTDPNSSCGTISQNTSGTLGATDNGFYWEIGDKNGVISDGNGNSAAGSVQPAGSSGGTHYTRTSQIPVASASKWIYGSFIAQSKADGTGAIPQAYVDYLNFTSGYDNMSDNCALTSGINTVDECLGNENDGGTALNGDISSNHVGHFYYNSGHMEHLEGVVLAGGSHSVTDLKNQVVSAFAKAGVSFSNNGLSYGQPDLAGGVVTSAADYAEFLKGMVRGSSPLAMRALLKPYAQDPYATCTNPGDKTGCGTALYSPLPGLSWHYALGHWIEDDSSDGSYSSPGKFGFYPWVDSTKTYYGIVARYDLFNPGLLENSAYYQSIVCGQAIRKAFMTGQVQN